jgi:hypothetical protein
VPPPACFAPVADLAVDALGISEEQKGCPAELTNPPIGRRLAGDDDEETGHVVGAVAVFSPWSSVIGVFEQPDVVAQRQEMAE